MHMEILCFFAGTAFFYTKHVFLLLFLLAVFFFRPRASLVVWFFAAFGWATIHQWWIADWGMPNEEIIKNALLQGYVASIPTRTTTKIQFQFHAERLNNKSVKAMLLLTCYDHCPELHAGQYWQLTAKLKKPHNIGNPGAFDYLGWLNTRHISWTGSVQRGSFHPLSIQHNAYPLLALRERLALLLAQVDPNEKTLGVLQALTLGVTNHIDKGEWDLFRRTGTIHLMVISGAHIGLVAGMMYMLTRWLWCRCSRLCIYFAAQKAASIMALFMALLYALLAGMGVPAQRALIVCFFMLLRYLCTQRFSAWQAWRYSLFTVLVCEPHSVLMPGFYLSFLAVAILLSVNQCLSYTGFKKMVVMQAACLFGLMPLTLFWFSYGAVNGLIANLVAVPWVSFVVIPLSLLTLVLGKWLSFPGLVELLNIAIHGLLYFLQWIDAFAVVNLNVPFTKVYSPLACMAAIIILVFFPYSRLFPAVLILIMAGLFPAYETIKAQEVRMDVLDVGQGLSVLVRTAHHALIYDTGVKFYRGTDMGKLAIMPYLDTLGIKQVDKIVISHPDLDHRGGLPSLEEKYSRTELIVDDPSYYGRGSSCHDHPGWVWDGISFRFFAIKKDLKGKNNHSCVLQVRAPGGQFLLTGDIETLAERYLTQTYGQELASTVLLIPHHGSKTSSSPSFIKQVAPRYAMASYGFDNRYHFPHTQAMAAYKAQHIAVFNTVDCGMISIKFEKGGASPPFCFHS
ncbi:DNA internalization-related competence protein ComEC/Rec2 [Legionella oakridgensis]|uniref:DNA internalization-related competence protein ComEC/Rec2 n=1 Tax=Legionella oakridgensis TaxID=29423 RepID=UPI0003DE0700|nr:DNA internalization-related competence protein ComEC/Rec2 [Legionella oakridgensis]ETO93484.1 DNA internalization-related competence protein ComEC/Rec2 [Legionella oakridgensis RV-2-2007]